MSMRELFRRQGIPNELISLRNALLNHHVGPQGGLRAALQTFRTPANGDGYACGCHHKTQQVAGDLAYVVPQWVAVDPADTRVIEGVITKSHIATNDFPLKPWHYYYDWCLLVRLDTQYEYLHSLSNVNDYGNVLECEWDSQFLPSWVWPQDGDRVWICGRWIYDCGHPTTYGHKTEIHPPKALVSFRSEAAQLPGNSGPVRASQAVVYIGRDGGYWRQPVNDRDYGFDLYLPPKPYPEAQPRWSIVPMTGALPVPPKITPFPDDEPRALRVVIPLTNVSPHPEQYGAIIAGGWSDPHGTEVPKIQKVRVRLVKIFMDGDYDILGDEWYVYFGINGRWHKRENMSGSEEALNFSVDLDLHPSDSIRLTACGFEADAIHDYMADDSGYSWAQISDPNITQAEREAIEDHIFWQLSGSFNDLNDGIGYLSDVRAPTDRNQFYAKSDNGDFRVLYVIEDR
ncbi:MAG: hypothetical protein ACXVDA_22965 [Ktedonobacterales bacterium]